MSSLRDKTISTIFTEVVRQHPDSVALCCGEVSLSYRTLAARADRLARYLRDRGVERNSIVAFSMPRSADALTCALAIIRAGGAYLPLDPEHPQSRLSFMLRDSAAKLVLTDLDALERELARYDDALLDDVNQADDLACVLYTSGSTGTPKGVLIRNTSVVGHVCDVNWIRFTREDRVAQINNLSFDPVTTEVWGAWLNGATLVMLPVDSLVDSARLQNEIREHALTKLFIPAGLLNIHASRAPGIFGGLETLASGGEAASATSFSRILRSATPPRRLVNVYGPTEATTQVTSYVVPNTLGLAGPLPARIPIGQPVTGARCLVLGSDLHPVADGEEGELFVGGRPLSAGYLNRPELNAERFIADPTSPEERLYRTGDLAVRSSDGNLDLVGRADEQIKIRDYRVEPGEIQSAIHGLPGVAQSYVMLREDAPGERKLVAYIVFQSQSRPLAAAELRKALRAVLPVQIVPDAFIVLPELPLTPNRKVDRTRLPSLDATAETLLPTDYPRALGIPATWSASSMTIAPELAAALAQVAARSSVSEKDAWLAVGLVLLARWSGHERVRVGVLREELQPALSAIDLTLPASSSFEHALRSARDARASVSGRSLPVQVSLAIFIPGDPVARAGAELMLAIAQLDAGTVATFHFREDLFEPQTIRRWLGHLSRLLQDAVERPQASIASLQLLSDADRSQLLRAFNATQADYPATKRLHDLIEERVQQAPRARALVYENVETSYLSLDHRANQLAHHLRALGVGSGTIVGICLTRSPRMIAAILAVLKAGGAYLPLDPDFPRERLAFMLADSGTAVLITERSVPELATTPNIATVHLDAEAAAIASRDDQCPRTIGTADDLAYVIYTSGSTGNPKGVMITHRAAVNFFASMQRVPGLSAADRVLAVTTLSFDIALLELLLPLATGATIVLASARERIDPALLANLLDRHAISLMQATPTTWTHLRLAGWTPKRNFRALVGGEVLPRKLASDLLQHGAEVWNMYGPTETTVWSTCWRVTRPERGIFIGTPIANTRCVVLDANDQLAPVGVYGELCIGGAGLARGYLNREDLTAEKFVSDPHVPGERLYRTGDRVRWRANGLLEFDGRLDRQIKLRGFRIELGEIEAELDACAAVERSLVVVREDRPGDQRLVAYVVSRSSDATRIRQRLIGRLPSHLVPSAIVVLDAFPLTANDKIDVRALPAPQDLSADRKSEQEHTDPLQQGLIEEWEETLNVHPVGLDDDFFELGGNSVLALTLLSRIAERFGRRLALASFFETPTVRSQAQLLKNELHANRSSSIVGIHTAGPRPPLFFASGWGGPVLKLRAVSRALGPEQPLYLLDYFPDRTTGDSVNSIEEIAARLICQMRTVQPNGPYHLVGYSLGAKIVYEIACQLHAAGEAVPALILLDSYAPGHPHRPPLALRSLLHLRKALTLGPLAMWPYLIEHFGRMREALLEHEPALYEGMTHETEAVPSLLWELNRAASAVYRAQMRYHFRRYPGTLLLIRADDLSEWGIGTTENDPTGGWQDWVGNALLVGSMPCGHRHMLDIAFAPRLAELMRSALARVEPDARVANEPSTQREWRVSG